MIIDKIAVLLINLGTPKSYQPRDVKKYLKEFLLDKRVIDRSWLWRQILVRCLIIPKKFHESSKFYKKIWTSEGSPLLVHSRNQQKLLQTKLGDKFHVELAMRYEEPSLTKILEKIKNYKQIIIFPLFPQYASATTGTIHEKVMECISSWVTIPEIIFINSFPIENKMIQAFCDLAKNENIEDYDHVLLSFHGLPQNQILKANQNYCLKTMNCCEQSVCHNKYCYSAQCYQTASKIISSLQLPKSFYTICFQSRLGKEPWLQPYFSDTLKILADQGKKKILVLCPSFVCDCIETIHEISIEYQKEFQKVGGEKLQLVPGLNDHPLWIESLFDMIKQRTFS